MESTKEFEEMAVAIFNAYDPEIHLNFFSPFLLYLRLLHAHYFYL